MKVRMFKIQSKNMFYVPAKKKERKRKTRQNKEYGLAPLQYIKSKETKEIEISSYISLIHNDVANLPINHR